MNDWMFQRAVAVATVACELAKLEDSPDAFRYLAGATGLIEEAYEHIMSQVPPKKEVEK